MTLLNHARRQVHTAATSSVLLLSALLTACGGGGDPVQPSCTVSAVSVSPASATIAVGATSTLTATPTAQNCSPVPTATWSSSAAGVATVSSSGLVTAVTPGSATITATVGGVSGSSTITVTPPPVATITLAPTTANLIVGATVTITPTTKDAGGNTLTGRTITFSSGTPAVASVSTAGVVTAVSAGTSTITVTSEGISATAVITVTLPPVASVTITPSSVVMLPLVTSSPTVVLKAADNSVLTGRAVAWTSSNTAVASVNATTGLITAVAVGSATITATSEGVNGTMTATVVPTLEANRYASIWNNFPSSAIGVPQTPSATYSQNGAGGANTVTRTGTGTYTVVFGKLAKVGLATYRENFFVTAYGSSGEYCRTGGWSDANVTDILVGVSCFSITGAPADSYFDLAMIGSGSLTGQYGFMWNSSAGSSVSGAGSSYSFSTGTGTVGSTRASTGNYSTTLGFTTGNKTAALVSTYVENAACSVDSWDIGAGIVTTKCAAFNSATPVDARSTVLLMESGRTGKRWGFAWANSPSTALTVPYTPSTPYQNSSTAQPITITRTAVGVYTVTFTGLGPTTFNGTMLTSAYANGGSPVGSCQIVGWGSTGNNVEVEVRCWNRTTAALSDQLFVIVAIE